MIRFIQRQLIIAVSSFTCLFGCSLSYAAQDVVFPTNTEFCLDQLVRRGSLSHTTLDYILVVPNEDQLKNGDVFVGFRRKSNPNVIWLKSSYPDNWSVYDGSGDPLAFQQATQLSPLSQLNILQQPTDLTAYSSDGQILVGYGRRTSSGATVKDSFQDMVTTQHYSVIWEVMEPMVFPTKLCLSTTGLRYVLPIDSGNVVGLSGNP